MAKRAYIGVDDVARKVKSIYIGVNGVARRVKKAYIGVGGVARLAYSRVTYKEKENVTSQFSTVETVDTYYGHTAHYNSYEVYPWGLMDNTYRSEEKGVVEGQVYKIKCRPMNPDTLWENFLFKEDFLTLAVIANDESVGKYVEKIVKDNETYYQITIPNGCETLCINCERTGVFNAWLMEEVEE